MTSGLRKLHFYSWVAIAVLGCVFLFFAIGGLDFSSKENSSVDNLDNTISLYARENDQIKVYRTPAKIRLVLKEELKASSSIVYALEKHGKKGKVLGQVTSLGEYVFDFSEEIQGILIFDPIKEVELTRLVL